MAKSRPKPLKRTPKKLTDLTPTEFENLIYDLAILRGMVNVAWRTPGADGGRDIEAATIERDFSGAQTVSTWFIECKRYTGSVDWPTIYGKLAYADALQADYLLLCTSAKFTPTAITQVDNWNSSRRHVLIRLWPIHEIEMQLRQHPDLSLKYGMSSAPDTPGGSIVSLALALSKAVASNYSEQVFQDMKPSPMLQASQAIASLLLRRMEDIADVGHIRLSFKKIPEDAVDGCTFQGDFSRIDEMGLRAFAAYIFALTKQPVQLTSTGDQNCTIVSQNSVAELLGRYREAFSAIATWSDIEFTFHSTIIQLRQRQ